MERGTKSRRLGTGLRRRCSGCLSRGIGRFGSRMRMGVRDGWWHLVVWLVPYCTGLEEEQGQ